jgi:hypothetical protein
VSNTETIRVSRAGFSMTPPAGEPLPITNVGIEMTTDGGHITELRLTFNLAPALWARLDTEQLFGLNAQARGALFAGGFEPEPDVEVEARLNPEHLAPLHAFSDNVYMVGAKVMAAADNPLRLTESWKALYIKQQRGPIKTGMQTNYV